MHHQQGHNRKMHNQCRALSLVVVVEVSPGSDGIGTLVVTWTYLNNHVLMYLTIPRDLITKTHFKIKQPYNVGQKLITLRKSMHLTVAWDCPCPANIVKREALIPLHMAEGPDFLPPATEWSGASISDLHCSRITHYTGIQTLVFRYIQNSKRQTALILCNYSINSANNKINDRNRSSICHTFVRYRYSNLSSVSLVICSHCVNIPHAICQETGRLCPCTSGCHLVNAV